MELSSVGMKSNTSLELKFYRKNKEKKIFLSVLKSEIQV